MLVIEAFPKDDQEYEVKWYGAVRKNSNFLSNPLVEVAIQNTATNEVFTLLAGVTELDALRVGTCWSNGKLTRTLNKIGAEKLETKVFEFNLTSSLPDVIDLFERNPDNPKYPYIPAYKFKLPSYKLNEESNQAIPKILSRYYEISYKRAKLNRLNSIDGKEVLISALETLTGLYTPSRKEIRREVLTKSVDDIISKHLIKKGGSQNPKGYFIEPKDSHLGGVPLVFLAYIAQNPHVQTIVDRISDTLEIADLNPESNKPYAARYPEILPYHPRGLKFSASGIWLDKERTRFLVIRINSVVAPEEIPIKVYKTIFENQLNPSASPIQRKSYRTINKAREVNVRSDQDPGRRAGNTYILSEIESTVGESVISTVYEVDIIENNVPSQFQVTESFKQSVEASAGEPFGTKSKVSQLENKENDRLDQLSVLRQVWAGLKALENVDQVCCVTERGGIVNDYYRINALTVLKQSLGLTEDEFTVWLTNRGGRKLLLIQVTMKDGSVRYILEIERATLSDSFSGAYFSGVSVTEPFISALCLHVAKKKNLIKLNPLMGSEGRFNSFSHRKGELKWVEKMGRILAKMPRHL